VFSPL